MPIRSSSTNVLNDPALARGLVRPRAHVGGRKLLRKLRWWRWTTALDDLSERMGDNMGRWRWDRIHITQYPHNPFSQVSYLKWLFHRTIPQRR